MDAIVTVFSGGINVASYSRKINGLMIILTAMMLARILTYPVLTVAILDPNMVVNANHIDSQFNINPLRVYKKSEEGNEIQIFQHRLHVYLVPALGIVGGLLIVPNRLIKKLLKVDDAKIEKYLKLFEDMEGKVFKRDKGTKSDAKKCQMLLLRSTFRRMKKIGDAAKELRNTKDQDDNSEIEKGFMCCTPCYSSFVKENPIWSDEDLSNQMTKRGIARTTSNMFISLILLIVCRIYLNRFPFSSKDMQELVPLDCTFIPEIKYLNPVKSIPVKFLPSVLLSIYVPAMTCLLFASVVVATIESIIIAILSVTHKHEKLVPSHLIAYFMLANYKLSQKLSKLNQENGDDQTQNETEDEASKETEKLPLQSEKEGSELFSTVSTRNMTTVI